jgi:sugar phosphate permease
MVPRRVLPLLLLAYAAFYLCRSNVEPAFNLLSLEYHYDNEQVGIVLGIALGAYAVGKLVLGPLADVKGGKRVLVGSLLATVAACMSIALLDAPRRFGTTLGLVLTAVLVVANRFVQAGGWSGLVNVVGQFFGPARRGTVMGILSTSYDVGNVVALILSAAIVEHGFGWRALFLINPAIVLVVAIVVRLALPSRPADVGMPTPNGDDGMPTGGTPTPAPADGMATAADATGESERVRSIAARLARTPAFWFAFALSFLLTFVRAGFMTWTPRFLYEVSVAAHVSSATSSSIAKSAFFGVAGIIGSVVTGRLSDRLGPGRRAPLMAMSLVLLVACTLALAHAGVSSPLVATVGVTACGLFLLGPYSLLSGAVSLDVAGPRGGATAAGFIDAIGYVGASLAAVVLGSVSKRAGWTAAFDVVATVAFLALVLSIIWTTRNAQKARHARDAVNANRAPEPERQERLSPAPSATNM